jgi:hypothetical protein
LSACYDLARNPPTYDVVAFLALLELERVRLGAESVDLYIRPGPVGGFRHDNLWPRSIEAREKLRDRVLMPLCLLLPSIGDLYVGNPPAHSVGVGERWISLPAILRALRQGCRPLRICQFDGTRTERVRGRITFTLREAEHHPLRNSRTEEWVTAAEELGRQGYQVLVIRDTARAEEPLSGCVSTSPHASINLLRRAYFYATADLNVGICNGPMWMAVFMDVPVLMLRPTTNAAGGCYDDRFYTKCGLPPGSQLPSSPLHQRLAWCEDIAENIVRETVETMALSGSTA